MSPTSVMEVERAIEQDKRDERAFKYWKRADHFLTISREKLIGRAAQDSKVEVTRHLISKGYGAKGFMRAISENEETAVRTFIKAGYDVNSEIDEETPLIRAISRKNLPITKMLIEAGADVNKKNYGGTMPMRRAIYVNAPDVVKLLIEEDADLEYQSFGKTALMAAAYWNRVVIAKILIEADAKVNAQNPDGTTALQWAVHQKSVGMLGVLIKAGSDLYMKGENGQTALEWAQELNYNQVVLTLRDAMEKQRPAKVQKSMDQWTVFDKDGSQMVTHTQYDAASTISVTDVFNFSTRMLLSEMQRGDRTPSVTRTHFKDLEPEVMEQAENKLTSTPKPKPARFKK